MSRHWYDVDNSVQISDVDILVSRSMLFTLDNSEGRIAIAHTILELCVFRYRHLRKVSSAMFSVHSVCSRSDIRVPVIRYRLEPHTLYISPPTVITKNVCYLHRSVGTAQKSSGEG